MKKCLWILGVLLLCGGSAKGQLFDVAGDFFTNSPRDSALMTFQMLSTDAKLDTTMDSIGRLHLVFDRDVA